ncbi:differentially expressed in FDCP 8 homolog B-like isoform X1 [Octopus sinensis]|uniref:Differentially expressed in FDCP 8 homolog B-like isoform X1 n=3 Tax=Octopus sinensis TaxID=2607531 RepID=A0A7E6FDS5_9MOLL|nr:differentially expressed in FDCP 8 homolog B-like isoform X1 [Octopus sinensis]
MDFAFWSSGVKEMSSIQPIAREWPNEPHHFYKQKVCWNRLCSLCDQFLVGYMNYSAQCTKCNATVHKWCAPRFKSFCMKGFPDVDRKEKLVKQIYYEGHKLVLVKKQFHTRRCWCCAGYVGRYYHLCYVCKVCNFICHPHCIGNMKLTCKTVQKDNFCNEIQGHKFVLTYKKLWTQCEKCHFNLDIFLTPAYKCKECGIKVHSDCKHFYNFECPSTYLSLGIAFLHEGDSTVMTQKFFCYGCDRDFYGCERESRFCHFSKRFYCINCHSNHSEILPDRVLLHWDFAPDTVCDWSRLVLRYMHSKSFISLDEVSSLVTQLHRELISIERILLEIISYYENLPECKKAFDKILYKIKNCWPNLLETPLHFSLSNFEDIYKCFNCENPSKDLFCPIVIESHEKIIQHVRHNCKTCISKSYSCAICCPVSPDSEINKEFEDVLYPFENSVIKCPDEECTFPVCVHRRCLKKNPDFVCPNCKSKIEDK